MPVERVQVSSRAVRELLRSREVEAFLRERAERIARRAGPGHRVDTQQGRNRDRAAVVTDSIDAMLGEALQHNLTRAIDAGRG